MFFIGPSTNIFVYLLVSAFFVICFYSKQETRLPETLPGYEIVVNYQVNPESVCHYREEKQIQSPHRSDMAFVPCNPVVEHVLYPPSETYVAPTLSLASPRAPPAC